MFLECLLRDGSDRSVFYEKTLMWILIAPFAVVVSALFWSLAVLYRNTCRRRWGHERRPLVELIRICKTNFIVTCIVLVFLLHPSVSAKVLEMVTCVEIVPNTGEYFLQSALELQCYTREHILWVVCAGTKCTSVARCYEVVHHLTLSCLCVYVVVTLQLCRRLCLLLLACQCCAMSCCAV